MKDSDEDDPTPTQQLKPQQPQRPLLMRVVKGNNVLM